jgi:hypothetical protein
MNATPEGTDVEPCAPTGSNVLPLGTQNGLHESYPSATATKRLATSQVSPNTVMSRNYQLEAALSKHLPPAGAYVDQYDLAHIPGLEDTQKTGNRCATCWAAKHHGSTSCRNRCVICGTMRHPGHVSIPRAKIHHACDANTRIGLSTFVLLSKFLRQKEGLYTIQSSDPSHWREFSEAQRPEDDFEDRGSI